MLSMTASKNIEKLVELTKKIHDVILSTEVISVIASFLDFNQIIELNLVCRQFYERLIPEAMDKCHAYNVLRV